jgi:hypothetical protein
VHFDGALHDREAEADVGRAFAGRTQLHERLEHEVLAASRQPRSLVTDGHRGAASADVDQVGGRLAHHGERFVRRRRRLRVQRLQLVEAEHDRLQRRAQVVRDGAEELVAQGRRLQRFAVRGAEDRRRARVHAADAVAVERHQRGFAQRHHDRPRGLGAGRGHGGSRIDAARRAVNAPRLRTWRRCASAGA